MRLEPTVPPLHLQSAGPVPRAAVRQGVSFVGLDCVGEPGNTPVTGHGIFILGRFGQTTPPLVDFLKDILRRYPEGGQILKVGRVNFLSKTEAEENDLDVRLVCAFGSLCPGRRGCVCPLRACREVAGWRGWRTQPVRAHVRFRRPRNPPAAAVEQGCSGALSVFCDSVMRFQGKRCALSGITGPLPGHTGDTTQTRVQGLRTRARWAPDAEGCRGGGVGGIASLFKAIFDSILS